VAPSGHRWGKDGEDATVAPLSRRAAQAPAQSLACFVSEWLPAVRPSLKPSTWDSYRSNLIHHVLPRLGEIPLTEIGPTDLNRLYVELLASGRVDGTGGLSQKTVHYIHTIVHRTLRDAIRGDSSTATQPSSVIHRVSSTPRSRRGASPRSGPSSPG